MGSIFKAIVPGGIVEQISWQRLEELRQSRLEVIKINGLRQVISENPKWYRDFCAAYYNWRRRRHRTIIKRCHTIAALKRIMESKTDSVYAERLMPFLEMP